MNLINVILFIEFYVSVYHVEYESNLQRVNILYNHVFSLRTASFPPGNEANSAIVANTSLTKCKLTRSPP